MGRGVVRWISAVVSSSALVLAGLGAFSVLPAAASSGSGRDIVASGTTSITDGGTPSSDLLGGPELASGPDDPGSDPTVAPAFPVDRSQTNGNSGHASATSETQRQDLNPTL